MGGYLGDRSLAGLELRKADRHWQLDSGALPALPEGLRRAEGGAEAPLGRRDGGIYMDSSGTLSAPPQPAPHSLLEHRGEGRVALGPLSLPGVQVNLPPTASFVLNDLVQENRP